MKSVTSDIHITKIRKRKLKYRYEYENIVFRYCYKMVINMYKRECTKQNIALLRKRAKDNYPEFYREEDFPSKVFLKVLDYNTLKRKVRESKDSLIANTYRIYARKYYPLLYKKKDFSYKKNKCGREVMTYEEIVYKYNNVYTLTVTKAVMKKRAQLRYPKKFKEKDFKRKGSVN